MLVSVSTGKQSAVVSTAFCTVYAPQPTPVILSTFMSDFGVGFVERLQNYK
jgi:hypothetical protein